MASFSERPWDMRNRDRDSFQFGKEPTAQAAASVKRRQPPPPADVGTVALAISGMTFYWMMPLLMRRRRQAPGQVRKPE
jgi:hypothetical protein